MSERAPIKDVNIPLGDKVSRMLYEAAKQSWDNRPGAVVEMHSSFSGCRAIRPDYKPIDCYEGLGSDGVGTKVEVAERTMDHSTVAFDLFAMVCDDALVRGAETVAVSTVLDVNNLIERNTISERAIRQLALGYVAAANAAGVVIINGEMAELGSRVDGYGEFNYNWGATALWYAQKDRLLTGLQIKPGDKLVGFVEPGMRSNGMTDARIAMLEAYGSDWHHRVVKELGSTTLGKLVQTPSTIYSKLVTNLTGGFDINREPKAKITGIAHITGGGQPSKLGRMLEPSGYGANINNPIDPPKIMLEIQRIRGFDDRTAYGKWHMGPGMVVATPEPEKVLAEAQKAGIDAQVIGSVTEEPGIWIRNKGAVGKEEFVTFEP